MKTWKFCKNLVSSLPSKNNRLALAVTYYATAETRILECCSILLDFITFCQVILPELWNFQASR